MAYFHCRARIWIRNWTQIPVLCRYYGKWIRIWIWVSGNMFCIILCSHKVWNPSLSPNLNPSPAVEITDYTTTEELSSRSRRPSWSRPSPTRGCWLGWTTRAQWDTDTYFSFSPSILIPSFSHERTLAGLEDTCAVRRRYLLLVLPVHPHPVLLPREDAGWVGGHALVRDHQFLSCAWFPGLGVDRQRLRGNWRKY